MNDRPLRILLVDDDEDDYIITRDLLAEIEDSRFELEWVSTYTAALEAMLSNRHDICLLDYRLGEHNGLELMREVFARGCTAPVILLTGQSDHDIDVEAMRAGAADYLVKGRIDAALLERSIRYAIAHAQAVQAMRESERRFRALIENTSDAIALIGPQGNILYGSPSTTRVLGYDVEEFIGCNGIELIHPDDRAGAVDFFRRLRNTQGETIVAELRVRHKDGTWRWVEATGTNLLKEPSVQAIVVNYRDVTARKQAEEQLLHDALHDALTGLPNRTLFMDRLQHAIDRAKRRQRYLFAVLFLDLDRFKVVNDSLGHTVGDQLLIAIAHRLTVCLRPEDTIARLGGDEFTVLLEDIENVDVAIRVAQRIQQELRRPFKLSDHEVFTTVSIGIALSTTGYDRPEDLLRDADTAMYRAKALGRARHEVFDTAMRAHAIALLEVETGLRRAIQHHEFRVHYQPVVALQTGRIIGFEALLRWQHPERGLILPAEFIPIAEETGLIIPIGSYILAEACRQVQVWQQQFPAAPPLSISVNLSSKQFVQPDMIEQVEQVLKDTGLDTRSLILEITESALIEDRECAATMLLRLKALGVRVHIDDFGTGYSSLSYLHRFPFDALKIDQAFVSRINVDSSSLEVVRAIVLLAHNLGLTVIAEGVETAEQAAELRALQCDYAQGYFFAGPLDAEGAGALLAAERQSLWSFQNGFMPSPRPAIE